MNLVFFLGRIPLGGCCIFLLNIPAILTNMLGMTVNDVVRILKQCIVSVLV